MHKVYKRRTITSLDSAHNFNFVMAETIFILIYFVLFSNGCSKPLEDPSSELYEDTKTTQLVKTRKKYTSSLPRFYTTSSLDSSRSTTVTNFESLITTEQDRTLGFNGTIPNEYLLTGMTNGSWSPGNDSISDILPMLNSEDEKMISMLPPGFNLPGKTRERRITSNQVSGVYIKPFSNFFLIILYFQ